MHSHKLLVKVCDLFTVLIRMCISTPSPIEFGGAHKDDQACCFQTNKKVNKKTITCVCVKVLYSGQLIILS